jgi:hypothetical protein
MLSNDLLNILAKFTDKEIKQFREFLNSPFFNKNENVIKLYNYIIKYHPLFKNKKLEKIYIYKKLFGTKKYNDGFMRTTIFKLNKLAEEYLSYISYKRKPINAQKFLLTELHLRNRDDLFSKALKGVQWLIEQKAPKDEFDILDSYIIEYEKNSFATTRYNVVTREEDLLRESILLERFFFISLLRRYSYLVNKGLIVEVDSKLNFLEDALRYVENNNFDDLPIASVYYNQLMLMLKGDEVYFENLKKVLASGLGMISKRDQYNTIINLQNYAIRKVLEGNVRYRKELSYIYQQMLSNNIFSMHEESGYMSHTVYRNIVMNSLYLNDFEWTQKFIKDYKEHLIPEHRDNAYYYALAKLSFEKKDFGTALEQLSRVNYEDILYKIDIKVFIMKIYYELGMEEPIYEVIDSFRHFLSKKKLYLQFIESGHNFIKIINKLLKINTAGSDIIDFNALKEEVNTTKNMVSREWLLKKIDDKLL